MERKKLVRALTIGAAAILGFLVIAIVVASLIPAPGP
jgi:flagellar biosynthesis protein FliP